MRVWYSGVSSDRIVGIWLCRMRYQYDCGFVPVSLPVQSASRSGVLPGCM
jgi:hypothetical protein